MAEGLTGEIVAAVERAGFKIVGVASRTLTADEAERFYDVHVGKPFFQGLVDLVTSGMSVGLLLEASEKMPDVVAELRGSVGATDPEEAEPGTLRAKYGKSLRENAVHASDSPERVVAESSFYFGDCPRAAAC